MRTLRSRIGHEITLRDKAGEERIELKTPDGKVAVVLDHAGGKLTITTDSDVEVHAGGFLRHPVERGHRVSELLGLVDPPDDASS